MSYAAMSCRRLKCNPDAPQRALRLRALREGKTVFMAVPRLTDERCFLRLDPARLGKGGDLEFALARAVGAVDARTTLLTTVHALQVLKGDIPMTTHDVPVDIVVTPERVIRTRTAFDKPAGIRWEELGADQLDAMPVLRRLRLSCTAGCR